MATVVGAAADIDAAVVVNAEAADDGDGVERCVFPRQTGLYATVSPLEAGAVDTHAPEPAAADADANTGAPVAASCTSRQASGHTRENPP